MKREVGTPTQAAPEVWESDIAEEAIAILKTILLLGKPYGSTYIARILRGDHLKYARDPSHVQLETFGMFRRLSSGELCLRLRALVDHGLLVSPRGDFNTFAASRQGEDFLDNPTALVVNSNAISLTPQDLYLMGKLSGLRRDLSIQEGAPVYAVFANYTMDCLAMDKPTTVKELLAVPGMDEAKVEQYGAVIVSLIKETEASWYEVEMQNLVRKTQHATHQEVLRLFREKHDTAEIAGILGIQPGTVRNYLMNFHRVGELDLRPWIESQFDSKQFHKITSYFKKMGKVRLAQAAKTLGVEVPMLALVRFYMNAKIYNSVPLQTA